jgi:hypothetical protein
MAQDTPRNDCTRLTVEAWGRRIDGQRWANTATVVATRHVMRDDSAAVWKHVVDEAERPLRARGLSIELHDFDEVPCDCTEAMTVSTDGGARHLLD